MNLIVKASLILAGLVTVLSVIVQVSGLNSNFMLSQMVFLVCAIAINVGVVVWALGKSAATNGYGGQVAHAAGIGVVAALAVTLISWFLLSVVFPDALAEMRAGAIAYIDSAGLPAADYDRQMAALDNATPMSQSIPGGAGTFFTSLITGAVFGIFKRRK